MYSNYGSQQIRQFVKKSFSNRPPGKNKQVREYTSHFDHLVQTVISYTVPFIFVSSILYGYSVAQKSSKDKFKYIASTSTDVNDMTAVQNNMADHMKRKTDFIKMEKLNDKYKIYNYIMNTHTKGNTVAEVIQRMHPLVQYIKAEMQHVSDDKIAYLVSHYSKYLQQKRDLLQQVLKLKENQTTAMAASVGSAPVTDVYAEEIAVVTKKVADLKTEFTKSLQSQFSAEEYAKLLLYTGPLEIEIEANYLIAPRKTVYVLTFDGDINASDVARLREEVSAVVMHARPANGDEVVVNLRSGGGTVTGYGLAAAQLARLRQAGIRLSVCVDEVAASGGYMMACVGNHVYASPFAAIGSIGVVSTMPNISERLKREGVEVEDITAGKYKRTLVPYKPVTEEDRDKMKADIEDIFGLFKAHIAANRPNLDLEAVATGEVWFGPDALRKGLVDSIRTSDDVLLDFMRGGADVYTLRYMRLPAGRLSSVWSDLFSSWLSGAGEEVMTKILGSRMGGGAGGLQPENFMVRFDEREIPK